MSRQKSNLNAQILEEAAEWFVEFDNDATDLVNRQAFDEWLRKSPEHVRAFLELLPIWEQGAAARPSQDIDPKSLIARALRVGTNVVPLNPPLMVSSSPLIWEGNNGGTNNETGLLSNSLPSAAPAKNENTSIRLGMREKGSKVRFAIAASLLLAFAGAWLYRQQNVYSTGIGEQRSITLADGSIVDLNALSRVRIRFAERERGVDLLAGQALFRVAHERTRPFIVRSGQTKIRAVGTQFDVYRKKVGTTVTVIEGRIAVISLLTDSSQDPSSASGAFSGNLERRKTAESAKSLVELPGVSALPLATPQQTAGPAQREGEVLLSAGEQTTVTPRAVGKPRPANLAAATAWTQRRLMFQKTSLAEVVDEFNRYNTRPLRLEDTRVQAFLVSGTFSSTDPASLLRFLREQPGIRVVEAGTEISIASVP